MNVVLRVHRDAIPVPIPPTGGEGNGPQHLPPPALEVGQKVGSEREGKGKERKRPPSPTTPRRSEKHHQPATTSRPGRLQDPQPRTPLQNLTRIYTRVAIAALPRPVPLHGTHTRPLLSSVSSPSRPRMGLPKRTRTTVEAPSGSLQGLRASSPSPPTDAGAAAGSPASSRSRALDDVDYWRKASGWYDDDGGSTRYGSDAAPTAAESLHILRHAANGCPCCSCCPANPTRQQAAPQGAAADAALPDHSPSPAQPSNSSEN